MASRVHRIEGEVEESEKWIQKYLANHPDLLPTNDLDGMETELRLIGCELNEMDLLFVDKRGLLTIVETKLYKNPEARREVIAQVQNYAAELSTQNVSGLCQLIAQLHGREEIKDLIELNKFSHLLSGIILNDESSKESEEKAKAVLAHYVVNDKKISDSPKLSPPEKQFLKKLDLMMSEGSFRLVIVTDKANSSLLELLNYVNSTMRRGHQLVAFEFTRWENSEGSKYLVPHLIGSPGLLSAEYYRKDNISNRRKWETDQFLDKLPNDLKNDVSQLIDLIDSDTNHFSYHYGGGTKKGELILCVKMQDGKEESAIGIKTDGDVIQHFGIFKKMTQQQKANLLSKIQSSPFLIPTYKTMEDNLRKGKTFTKPILKLKNCGAEGQRAKNLLQYLEDFYLAVNSVS